MKVYDGCSKAEDAVEAVREATAAWPANADPQMIFAFHSTRQDAQAIAQTLHARFPNASIAGCTTAGEHLSGRHFNGALVLAGLDSSSTRWAIEVVNVVDEPFDAARAEATRNALLAKLGRTADDLDPSRHACIAFMDGLSLKEEGVTAHMAEALTGVALVGGSAGDDLKFVRTQVIAGDKAYDRSVVFVLVESDEGLEVLKHQHFITTPHRLAVTKVDVEHRRVLELDGLPAAEAFARALGIPRDALTSDVAFGSPLTFECNGDLYVRSVQKIETDGTIAFFCAIEEGMVLHVGGHLPIDEALDASVRHKKKKAAFLLACNCILRALEADKSRKHDVLGGLLNEIGAHVVGFDTYGEQLNGLHINQTVVGLAMGVPR